MAHRWTFITGNNLVEEGKLVYLMPQLSLSLTLLLSAILPEKLFTSSSDADVNLIFT